MPGNIICIHRDGTLDVTTDNSKNIPQTELMTTLQPAHHHGFSYTRGETVQVYSRSREEWAPAKVNAVHSNGSIDVTTWVTKQRMPPSLVKAC